MTSWDCEAYGPEGTEFGAICFASPELGQRLCSVQAECKQRMDAARQHAWQQIQQGAAAGDPDMAWLAGEFTSPGQLLGGGDDGASG